MHKDVTIYDLARELNLSPATISRGLKKSGALNKDCRIGEKQVAVGELQILLQKVESHPAIMELLTGAPVPEVKFFHMVEFSIAGHTSTVRTKRP